MIRLAAFADEADSSLAGQIEALKRNSIDYVELRGINGVNIADVTCEQAKEYAKELSDAGIKVWSIGSPIGKISINGDLDAHRDKLRHICRLAHIFGTDKIRMFSFFDAQDSGERVFAQLRALVDIANEEKVKLYHENEKAIYGDTPERVQKIMANVEGLHYVYDPANFIEVGEEPQKALTALHSAMGYFHIKDVIADTKELVPAGYGDGMIDRLIAMIPENEEKVLTIEPHLAIFDGYAQIDGTEMKNKFRFTDNNAAFDAAADALKNLLEAQGYIKVKGGYEKNGIRS